MSARSFPYERARGVERGGRKPLRKTDERAPGTPAGLEGWFRTGGDSARDGYLGDVLSVNMTMFTGGALSRTSARFWDADKAAGVSTLTM